MKWRKAPAELKAAIEAATTGLDCERRVMFGFPAYFVRKNMFAGLFEDRMFLRMSPEMQAEFAGRRVTVTSFEPMPGRPMKAYQLVPDAVLNDPAALRALVAQSFAYTSTLPPKFSPGGRKAKGSSASEG
jgi:hypothetical protein